MSTPTPWVDPEVLRRAMRLWATGVTIVTSSFQGVRHGMTVSSFTSIDLEPPLVLVSIEHSTRTHGLIQLSGAFGVTVLGQDQQAVSDRFAGRTPDDQDRFADTPFFSLTTGAPLILGGLACLDCRVQATFDAGIHTLFIGEVIDLRLGASNQPLLYFNREYRHLK